MENNDKVLPWYKQFWPWYLIFLPASAVVAGITTLIIAVNNQDHMVVDNYYKQGLAINRVISAQQQAAKLGLQARAIFDASNGKLTLMFAGNRNINEDIRLSMIHPTLSKLDREFTLSGNRDNYYELEIKSLEPGRWNMMLESVDQSWRLDTIIELPATQWTFKPDV
jgi:hypothetical protein